MNQAMKNKAFILEYFNAMSRNEITPELLAQYITDQGLIEHIMFFESVFPKYKMKEINTIYCRIFKVENPPTFNGT